MLGVFAPAATYGRRDSTVAAHQRLAFTIPGDFVRILLSLPLIDANADEPVDLWTTPEAQPLQGLLGRQSCISRVLFSPCKQSGPSHTAEPGCPIPVYGRYRDVIHLGLRDSPDEYYPHWLARKLGLQAPSRGFRLRCIPPAGQSDISPKRKRGQQLLSSLTLRVNVECAILNRGRCHGERNGPSGAVVLDMPPGDLMRGDLEQFCARASNLSATVSCLRSPISSTSDVERVAGFLASASLFVGRYSWRACIAILAGVPTVVLRRPEEECTLRLAIPPNRKHLWQADWIPGNRLPDPVPFMTEIAQLADTGC